MTRLLRLTAFQLAICAMLLRALIPAGWMPNLGADTGSLFTICSADAGVSHSGQDGQKPAPDRHEVCPFAAAPHLATPLVAAALSTPSLIVALAPDTAAPDQHNSRGAHSPQSPRAPPTLA